MKSHLLIYDFETTGTDWEDDEPCQVGAVLLSCPDGKKMYGHLLMNSLCRTTKPMSEGAAAIHGITPEVMSRHPHFNLVLKNLMRIVRNLDEFGVEPDDEVYLSGYNIEKFDTRMFFRLMPEAEAYFTGQVDAYRLNLRLFPERLGKLVDFYQHMTGKEPPADAHDAVADCMMVADTLRSLARENFPAGPELMDFATALYQELQEPCILPVYPYGKHRGTPLESLPSSFVSWAVTGMTDVPNEVVWTLQEAARIHQVTIPSSSWLGIRLAELGGG